MAISMHDLTSVLDGIGARYHAIDDETLLFGLTLDSVKLALVFTLGENGEFLDIRTHELATIEPTHPAYDDVTELLSKVNADKKVIKFGIDRNDGEVTAHTALAIEDNDTLTRDQIGFMLAALGSVCGEVKPQIERLMQRTGPSAKPREEKSARPTPAPEKVEARPAVVPEPPRREAPSVGGSSAKSPAATIAAVGVILIGLAALLGVVYLFVK